MRLGEGCRADTQGPERAQTDMSKALAGAKRVGERTDGFLQGLRPHELPASSFEVPHELDVVAELPGTKEDAVSKEG